ncbi:MAG: hypothetical protein ACP5RN_01285 [Armatimonadota bacterium]
MQVAAITGKRQAQLVERETPHAWGDVVVVKIHVTPMCTEYKLYRDGHVTDVLGHEAAGEVVEVAQPGLTGNCGKVLLYPWGETA